VNILVSSLKRGCLVLSSKYKSVKNVPVQDQNLLIESDEKRIKQVLMNLQSNALKFTREGGKIQIITEFVQADKAKS
jgi:signal transduction histidine kinase